MDTKWLYRPAEKIVRRSLHIEVIADYGGGHSTDHAFNEVTNHFYRFDQLDIIRTVSIHPVYAFSTIETGFWIAQEGLHSEHKNLVIFSNTAPRGDIVWHGEDRQYFVCGLLDNGIPIFAVNAGYNLSFIKSRLKGLWEVKVANKGTQFRSRDYYPGAAMDILNGNLSIIGNEIDLKLIPDIPQYAVASVDGYGNLKTTIKKSHLTEAIVNSRILRVTINDYTHFILNTLSGNVSTKISDLCLVSGSSGGRKGVFLEFIKMQGRAADEFAVDGPNDDMQRIIIEPVKV